MSKYTEINVAKPLKFEHRMKVNDLVSLGNQQSHVSSEGIEIFPGVNDQFLLKIYEKLTTLAASLISASLGRMS